MKYIKTLFAIAIATVALSSCNKESSFDYTIPPTVQDAGKVTLQFENYVGNEALQLNHAYTSNGQSISFSEVKYVITNIAMIKENGDQVVYNWDNLNKAGYIIDQAEEASRTFVLDTMAAAKYKSIRFGLGVKKDLNSLTTAQRKSADFYTRTQTKGMQWAWADGFQFAKFAGTYGTNNDELSILIGSGKKGKKLKTSWNSNEDRDAFRYVTLDLPTRPTLAKDGTLKIVIKADLDKILNGENRVTLSEKIPADQDNLDKMFPIVNNIGGRQDVNGKAIIVKKVGSTTENLEGLVSSPANKTGMFSVLNVQ